MSLFDKKLSELHDLLQKKEISVSDLVDESFQRIQ
ncbi:MAG: glutaminyl-tRNA synthetase, partial [Bacillales bacterium]